MLRGRRGLVVVIYNVDSDTHLVRAIEKEYLELSAIVNESAQENVSAFRYKIQLKMYQLYNVLLVVTEVRINSHSMGKCTDSATRITVSMGLQNIVLE